MKILKNLCTYGIKVFLYRNDDYSLLNASGRDSVLLILIEDKSTEYICTHATMAGKLSFFQIFFPYRAD